MLLFKWKMIKRQPNDLTSIYVKGNNNNLVQLSNIVQLEETVAPKELNHFNKFRAATINGNVASGYGLGDVLDYIDSIVQSELPKNIVTDLNGQSLEFRETGAEMYITLALAIVFIYLVLAAQFESFLSPFSYYDHSSSCFYWCFDFNVVICKN